MKHPALILITVAAAITVVTGCDKHTSSGQTVGQKVDRAIDKTNEAAADVSMKVSNQIDKAGNAIATVANDASRAATGSAVKVGDAITDAAITASIKADLIKDPELLALKIDVDTKEGVVALNGLTPNQAARERAGRMAGAVKGVIQVDNRLAVKQV